MCAAWRWRSRFFLQFRKELRFLLVDDNAPLLLINFTAARNKNARTAQEGALHAMDVPVLTVKAKYMGSSKKGPPMPGVLTMSDMRFKWIPSDVAAFASLNVEFNVIKAHFFSKGKKALLNLSKGPDAKAEGYVFEYDDVKDRDTCRDHVAKILGRQNSAGVGQAAPAAKPIVAMAPGVQSDQFDRAEMERRLKLLQTDSELQKLHSQLVIGGVLSETEFWSARKHMLDEDPTRGPKQKTGLKTAMLADVRPLTDGRTNKVTFNLTPEIIHQIFTEKPAVHRAFLQNVPAKMSEVDFWTKYCRSEYLYRTKNQAAAAAEAADDEELAVFTREDDIIETQARKKMKRVDPTLDIAADMADDYTNLPGHGIIYRDGSKEPEYNTGVKVRSIMNDINRHAAVVLEGRPLDGFSVAAGDSTTTATVAQALAIAQQSQAENEKPEEVEQKRLARLRSMTLNDDLLGPQQTPHVPLTIQDPRKYFDSQGATAGESGPAGATTSDPAEALDFFHEQLAAWKKNGWQKSSFMPPAVALKVVTDVTKEFSSTKFTLGRTAEKNVLDSLPKGVKEDLLQQSAAVHELLRHFWACYPLTSKFLLDKANRLKEAMSQIYTRLQNTKESAPAELRHQISQLVQPMLQALDAAFTHYDDDAQTRASKRQSSGQHNGSFAPKLVEA